MCTSGPPNGGGGGPWPNGGGGPPCSNGGGPPLKSGGGLAPPPLESLLGKALDCC